MGDTYFFGVLATFPRKETLNGYDKVGFAFTRLEDETTYSSSEHLRIYTVSAFYIRKKMDFFSREKGYLNTSI